ncbi:SPARC-like protein 1 isoform X1 [Pleurodeles waltl]|nr:SPARCL1 [Pleurodeles waltl]
MKTLVALVCLLGTSLAVPTNSLRHQFKQTRKYFPGKDGSIFSGTFMKTDYDHHKTNSTESHEVEITSSESKQDYSESQSEKITNHNGPESDAQRQNQNNSENRIGNQDNFSFLSAGLLAALDALERPTMRHNESHPNSGSNESLGMDKNSLSKEKHGKDQTAVQQEERRGSQEENISDSVENATQEYHNRAHISENDDGELSEDYKSDEEHQGQPIITPDYPKINNQVEDSISSEIVSEESSQNPQYAQSEDNVQERFRDIQGTAFEEERVNASSTENKLGENTELRSQEDHDSDQINSQLEEQANIQSLYEAQFLDATEIDNEDKQYDVSYSNKTKLSSDVNDEETRSEEKVFFEASKTFATEGSEIVNVEDHSQEKGEGDGGVDTNETGEDTSVNMNLQMNVSSDFLVPVTGTSLGHSNDSLSESAEQVVSIASLNEDHEISRHEEKKNIILDPCQNFRCKRGKICEKDEKGTPTCACQDIISCPQTIKFDQVCGTDNKTYDSECHLFGTKCQMEGSKNGSHLHLDYRGSCKHIPSCSEYELTQFPLRMRDWLKNVLMQLYESDLDVSGFLTEKQRSKVKKIYQHEKRLKNGNHTLDLLLRDFQKNYRMYVYPVHWQFSQLDHHPVDRRLSHSELAPLRAPLVPMEHCITEFFKECNTDNDKFVSLKEWCHCFGIKDEDVRESLLF